MCINSRHPLLQLVEQRAAESSETKAETNERLSLLEDQLRKSEAAAAQAQKEVDRLLLILQESETEKNKLEEQIQEQQKYVSFFFRIEVISHSYKDGKSFCLVWKNPENHLFFTIYVC